MGRLRQPLTKHATCLTPMRGKCLCGNIEFELVGATPKFYQCHCSLCRKQGGSSSNTATIVESSDFRWVSGQDGISSFIKPTGFRSDFCSKCGSPVPNPLRNTPYYWVPAGLLEGSDKLEIVAHLYVGSKASWDSINSSGTQYETMPRFATFLQLLHASNVTEPGG